MECFFFVISQVTATELWRDVQNAPGALFDGALPHRLGMVLGGMQPGQAAQDLGGPEEVTGTLVSPPPCLQGA